MRLHAEAVLHPMGGPDGTRGGESAATRVLGSDRTRNRCKPAITVAELLLSARDRRIWRNGHVFICKSPLQGTGSVSCNSVFVLYLCRLLNQEELMKRETMVQNP